MSDIEMKEDKSNESDDDIIIIENYWDQQHYTLYGDGNNITKLSENLFYFHSINKLFDISQSPLFQTELQDLQRIDLVNEKIQFMHYFDLPITKKRGIESLDEKIALQPTKWNGRTNCCHYAGKPDPDLIKREPIGPNKIEHIFINSNATQISYEIDCRYKVTGRDRHYYMVSFICNLNKNQSLDQLQVSKYKENKVIIPCRDYGKIIGYLDNVLLRVNNKNGFVEFYFDDNKSWISMDGIDCDFNARDCKIFHLPLINWKHLSKFGLFYYENIYGFDTNSNKFIKLKLFDDSTNKEVVNVRDEFGWSNQHKLKTVRCDNGRVFFVKKDCLFELIWSENEMELRYKQHLLWIDSIECINDIGKYGLAVLFKRKRDSMTKHWIDHNDCLILYNPENNMIYKYIHKHLDNEWFNQYHKVTLRWDNVETMKQTQKNQQDIVYCVYSKLCGYLLVFTLQYILILKDEYINKYFPCKPLNECVDQNWLQYDTSFNQYKSKYCDNTELINMMFLTYKNRSNIYRINQYYAPKWNAEYYHMIAGFNCNPNNKHLNLLKSKDFINLHKLQELGDYLGATVWYQTKSGIERNKHHISVASLLDFPSFKRSSEVINVSGNEWSNHYLYLNEIEWIGIVDMKNDKDYKQIFTEKKTRTNLFRLSSEQLQSKEFIIKSGFIVCGDCRGYNYRNTYNLTQFNNVENGKWCWIYKNRQLLAYHESVKDDNTYCDHWKLPKEEECPLLDQDVNDDSYKDFNLETIDESIEKREEMINILNNNDTILSMNICNVIIDNIAQFCYYQHSLNWIHKKLNDGWLIHKRLQRYFDETRMGICDYMNYGNCQEIEEYFDNNCIGYDWYLFSKNTLKFIFDDMIETNLSASIGKQFSLKYGCVSKWMNRGNGKNPDNYFLAKMDPNTNTIKAIRIIHLK